MSLVLYDIFHLVPFAALLALFYVALGIYVVRKRYATKTPLGVGKNEALLRAQRAHGNFGEYVPLALLLIVLDAFLRAPPFLIDLLGGALLLGRLLHAYSVLHHEPHKDSFRYRMIGMPLTFGVLVLAALYLLFAWAHFQFA